MYGSIRALGRVVTMKIDNLAERYLCDEITPVGNPTSKTP
jgi:hypothetical protein